MPIVVQTGVSVVGWQVTMVANLTEPGYAMLFIPGQTDPTLPRFGWAYLYSYNQAGTRFAIWRSQALTSNGVIFSTAGRPGTANAQHALAINWRKAGIPWQCEYSAV